MSNLHIVMYHYVRDLSNSRYPSIKGLDTALFEQQLRFFKQHFDIVRMEDVLQNMDGAGSLPDNPLLLTFDDGYIDHFTTVFPLLLKQDLQGSFFISGKVLESKLLDVNKVHFVLASSDIKRLKCDVFELLDEYRKDGNYDENDKLYEQYGVANRFDDADTVFVKRILQTAIPEDIRSRIADELFERHIGVSQYAFARELYLTGDQLLCMKRNGMFIGLHGYDHYWLGNLKEAEMKYDIDSALDAMSPFVDKSAWVMNYPYGSLNDDVVSYISRKGCVLGLTTEARAAALEHDNRYRLPRFDCNDFPPKSERYLKAAQ